VKLKPGEVDRFVKALPQGMRAVLVHGPDEGKVREIGERIGKTVVADLGDPFNVSSLIGDDLTDDPARLADEASAQSLMGGRRLVRLRDVTDKHAGAIENALSAPTGDSLIVVEGGDLKAGALRKLFEGKREDLAAIPCYADEVRDIAGLVKGAMQAANIRIDRDAEQYLIERLGGDRFASRNEIDKLVLMVGDGGKLDLETVADAIGDGAALAVDALVSATADGRPAGILPALDRAFAQGESPIRILRIAQGYFQRLHLAAVRAADGRSPADAVKSLRPPVFWKAAEPMTRQVASWNPDSLSAALARLGTSEIRCKTTGYPAEAECGQALIDVARIAAMAQRSGRARR
jgi:DNA polymerase-3 subunit delta